MTLIDTFPRAALDLVLVALLPIIAPTVGNAAAAEALALRMLDEYHPTTIRELHMAGEAIGFRLDALRAEAEAHEPGITAEQRDNARKWACSLTRSEHQVLRALAELKRHQDALGDFALLRRGNRLSVLPVTAAQWAFVLGLEDEPP